MTKYYQEGIKVKLLPDKRHLLCKAKTIGLLPNILAINQANCKSNFSFSLNVFFWC